MYLGAVLIFFFGEFLSIAHHNANPAVIINTINQNNVGQDLVPLRNGSPDMIIRMPNIHVPDFPLIPFTPSFVNARETKS
jgi:hypothetical protein